MTAPLTPRERVEAFIRDTRGECGLPELVEQYNTLLSMAQQLAAELEEAKRRIVDMQEAADDAQVLRRQYLACAETAERQLARWKATVIDDLVVCHIYTEAHNTDPRKALTDLIDWHVTVALDFDDRAESAERELARYREKYGELE